MKINLELDNLDVDSVIYEDVCRNKSNNVSYEYFCPRCNNRLSVRSKSVSIVCSCGGLMRCKDTSLIEFRHKKKLSQKQLADLIGVSRNYISMIENGDRPISKSLKRFIGGNI